MVRGRLEFRSAFKFVDMVAIHAKTEKKEKLYLCWLKDKINVCFVAKYVLTRKLSERD